MEDKSGVEKSQEMADTPFSRAGLGESNGLITSPGLMLEPSGSWRVRCT